MRSCLVLLAVAATGCLSSATEKARSAAASEVADGPAYAPAKVGASSTPTSDTCEAIGARIAARHPAPLAAMARARASLRRSHAAASAPGPTVWVELWDFPIGDPERADREGMYMVGVRQEIPVLGALDADARAQAEEARAQAAEGRDDSRKLYQQAALACVDWAVSARVADRYREYGEHLKAVREAGATAYAAGAPSSLGSVARFEADAARIERRAIELDEQARASRDALVALAGEGIAIPEDPPALRRPPNEIDVESVIARALSARGDVAAARARSAAANARADAARAVAEVPKFEVAGTYMQTPGERAGLGAMVSMSMPWLGGGLADASDAAQEETTAANHQAAAAERAAEVEITTYAARLGTAQRALQSLEERELPAAERAAEAERAGLAAGSFDLTAWLLSAHMVLETRIEEEVMKGAVARAWIELEAASASSGAGQEAR